MNSKTKQLLLIFLLTIGMANTSFCQNILTGLNAPAHGVKIKANFPGYTGGWSRGFRISNEDNSKQLFSFGAMGNVNNGISNISYGWIGRSYSDAFIYFKPNGNIGIGTATPNGLLEVKGIGNPYKMFRIISNGGGGLSIGANTDDSNPIWNIQTNSNEKLNFNIGGTNTMFMASGSVGIGTTAPNPNYKLDVLGTIRARELKVDMQGADFVFEEDYPLRPISELEDFVKTNKHLPEIAPAKEMQENGVNQSEMNQKLLQKIEELTLYVIEINNTNEILKKKVKELEK